MAANLQELLEATTAADLEHLLALKRAEEAAATDQRAAEIADLDEHRENWREQIPNRPSLGAYKHLRRELSAIDPVAEIRTRHRDDPTGLVEIVREIARFSHDREVIVRTAVAHAETCGITEDVFVPIITDAIRNLPRGGDRHVG